MNVVKTLTNAPELIQTSCRLKIYDLAFIQGGYVFKNEVQCVLT